MQMYKKGTARVGVEVISDQMKIFQLMDVVFQPDALVRIAESLDEATEIFLSFAACRREELPQIRLHLLHLVRDASSICYVFHVHKDDFPVAEEMAKIFKANLKNEYEWDTTERLFDPDEDLLKLIRLPPIPVKTDDDY